MDEQWHNRDLKLKAEKRRVGESDTTTEEWTQHVCDLKEGELTRWAKHGGFYRTPYEGPHTYRIVFLEAKEFIKLRLMRDTVQVIDLDDFGEWTSGWYEMDGYSYRITINVITSLYAVSELPEGVRTMQQQDHDAWDYAVRNGLI
ncbi:MAG: hypothetical protein IJ081_07135 [Prevotella sp.]|nr:hypothetical protein [Prevotella sp.]